MRTLRILLISFCLAPLGALATDAVSHLQISLLLSKDLETSKLGAQSIHFSDNPSAESLDTVAELLLNATSTGKSAKEIDVIAWYAKVLSDKNKGRYDAILRTVSQKEHHEKVQRHLKGTTESRSEENGYAPNSTQLGNQPHFSGNISESVNKAVVIGHSVVDVYSLYGEPSKIELETANFDVSYENRKMVALTYPEAGRILVTFSPKEKMQWIVRHIEHDAEQTEGTYTYTGPIEYELHGYLSLLSSTNPIESKLGTRSIYQDELFEPEILDIVAEQLFVNKVNEDSPAFVDTIAWYAKTLGESKNARYAEILSWAKQHYSNKKIHKHIDEAVKSISRVDGNQYKSSNVSLGRLRKQLAEYGNSKVVAREKREYNNLMTTMNLREMYKLLGTPDAIEDLSVRSGWGMYGRSALMLLVHYYDYGAIQFIYDGDTKPGWILRHLMPSTASLDEVYAGPHRNLANTLWSARGSGLWMTMHPIIDDLKADPSMMQLLSKRLLVSADTLDKWEIKALAHISRFIAATGDKEYLPILQEAAQKSGDSDLRDYIDDAIERLSKK